MFIIKAEYLKKYPVYFHFPMNGGSEGTDFDPVAEIEKSSTFTEKAVAEAICKRISDFFSLHPNYHYDNVRAVKVKIQEIDGDTFSKEEGQNK